MPNSIIVLQMDPLGLQSNQAAKALIPSPGFASQPPEAPQAHEVSTLPATPLLGWFCKLGCPFSILPSRKHGTYNKDLRKGTFIFRQVPSDNYRLPADLAVIHRESEGPEKARKQKRLRPQPTELTSDFVQGSMVSVGFVGFNSFPYFKVWVQGILGMSIGCIQGL